MRDKSNTLFYILGTFFVANALLAEFIGVKIFSLEKLLGIEPINLSFFGESNLSFNLTAGVLLWPVVFIMTDIINEYFGRKGVRFMSFTAATLITYAFLMVYLAMGLSPADFWIERNTTQGTVNMDMAFNTIFGQGLWIIAGSLTAFLIGQLVDVYVFHFLRSFTGSSKIWFRATGSTLVSQFIDMLYVEKEKKPDPTRRPSLIIFATRHLGSGSSGLSKYDIWSDTTSLNPSPVGLPMAHNWFGLLSVKAESTSFI